MARMLLAAVAAVALVAPRLASAAPATVSVFEAQVHAQPDASSPVVHTFAEGARVSVSEDVVGGFRKVRLPDGKVGYVAAGAVALDRAAAPPPAAVAPQGPPPPYALPPPPPPPPPGYVPYHRVVVYPDPNAYRHVGLFLRMEFGLGYLSSTTSSAGTYFIFDSSHGLAGDFAFALGGAVKENLIVAGQFWGDWVASPHLTLHGQAVPSGGDLSGSVMGVGPSFTWFLMPANVSFSVTPSLTWVNFSDYYGGYTTDVGFGTRFSVGKEWWVAPHWGIGVGGWFTFSFNSEGGGASATWDSYSGGVAFTATLN